MFIVHHIRVDEAGIKYMPWIGTFPNLDLAKEYAEWKLGQLAEGKMMIRERDDRSRIWEIPDTQVKGDNKKEGRKAKDSVKISINQAEASPAKPSPPTIPSFLNKPKEKKNA